VFDALDALLGPLFFQQREGVDDPRACPQCGDRLVIKPARGQGAFIGCSDYSKGGCSYSRPLLVAGPEQGLDSGMPRCP
jgi:ssDNA-binding Zn-finger/Zn-ribbon topoisomerase 1